MSQLTEVESPQEAVLESWLKECAWIKDKSRVARLSRTDAGVPFRNFSTAYADVEWRYEDARGVKRAKRMATTWKESDQKIVADTDGYLPGGGLIYEEDCVFYFNRCRIKHSCGSYYVSEEQSVPLIVR